MKQRSYRPLPLSFPLVLALTLLSAPALRAAAQDAPVPSEVPATPESVVTPPVSEEEIKRQLEGWAKEVERTRRETEKAAERARLAESKLETVQDTNQRLNALLEELEKKSKEDEAQIEAALELVTESTKEKSKDKGDDSPLNRSHISLGVGFARNSSFSADTPDRVSFVANQIRVMSGAYLGKQDMFNAYGTTQIHSTIGGEGVNFRTSVQTGLNVMPSQLTRYVIVGLEPVNMELDLGTLDGRKNFFSWNPMLAGGVQVGFNVGEHDCSVSFLGKGGFSIGTLGQGTRTKGAAGGQVLLTCGAATFAGEWLSLDTTKPLANDNFLRSALFVDIYRGIGVGFQAEGQFLKQETFGSNPALQDQSSRRFFGVVSISKDLGSLFQ